MATGQVGEVWVAGGAAEFTSGNIPGGGAITGGFLRSSGGFPGGAFHILSPESDLKARRVRFSGL